MTGICFRKRFRILFWERGKRHGSGHFYTAGDIIPRRRDDATHIDDELRPKEIKNM
jgi:hypothetical protein